MNRILNITIHQTLSNLWWYWPHDALNPKLIEICSIDLLPFIDWLCTFRSKNAIVTQLKAIQFRVGRESKGFVDDQMIIWIGVEASYV